MSKRQRMLLVWANVVIVTGFYVWYFGIATLFVLETRWMGWKSPVVKETPVELKDLSISHAPGGKLSYFGYEFEVPWDDLDEGKLKQVGRIQVIRFTSGKEILFSRSAPKEFVKTFLSSLKTPSGNFQKMYGEDAFQSDFALHRLILEATPQKVGLLTDRRDAVGTAMLLVFKGIMMPGGGETGIFRVRTGDFRGFQYGDPQSHPKSIDVEIFADDGGLGFVFTQQEKEGVPAITQAEINRFIQGVRKIPQEGLSASR
jgi:hypothetical protein